MSLNKYFLDFLSDYVNINDTRLQTARSNIAWVRGVIERANDFWNILIDTSRQGSLRHGTIIRPIHDTDTFDTDLLVEIDKPADWSYSACINKLWEIFLGSELYRDKVVPDTTRCITINYAGENSIDIVPTFQEDGEYYIANRKVNSRELSDGQWFAEWFDGQNKKTNGHLKRFIRLIKYARNYKNFFDIKSIHLNIIIWKMVDNGGDYSNLCNCFVSLVNNLQSYLSDKYHIEDLDLINPANANEDMGIWRRNLSDSELYNFKSFIDKLHNIFNRDLDDEEILKELQHFFWDDFGEKYYDDVASVQSYQGKDIISDKALLWRELRWSVEILNPTYVTQGEYRGNQTNDLGFWEFIWTGNWPTFYAQVRGIEGSYEVYWQVLNTGREATEAKAQRWEIFTWLRRIVGSSRSEPSPDKHRNMEYTSYIWTHWVKCFVVQNNKLVAESSKFYIRIK